jgi:hypothetical protein
MIFIWMALFIGAGAVAFAAAGARRKQSGRELGSMSEEWVAEQRANEPYYRGR